MKTAAVDIGTNSVRLLIAEVKGGEKAPVLRTLHRCMTITRLGEGVDGEGRLLPSAMERTLETLRRYRGLMEAEGVEVYEVAATSAVRDARNAASFRREVKEILGREPRVLAGEEEAHLSFLGATYDLGDLCPAGGLILVVDIGGGSTEVILGEGEDILLARSLDVGCVRMTERFLVSDPPTGREIKEMEDYLRSLFRTLAGEFGGLDPSLAVGLAGTVTTLSGIRLGLSKYDGEAIHHTWLDRTEVEELYGCLAALPVAERKRFMRLEPGRADVIVGGCGVLTVLMKELELRRLLVSEKDILDGLVLRSFMEKRRE